MNYIYYHDININHHDSKKINYAIGFKTTSTIATAVVYNAMTIKAL